MAGNKNKTNIVMVGPDINGLGGISRVVKICQEGGFFVGYDTIHLSTVTDEPVNRLKYLIRSFCRFLYLVISRPALIYIHTSSYRSFYRKVPFILVALFFKKRVILHIHPTHFLNFLNDGEKIKRYLIISLLNQMTALVVLSEKMKRKLSDILSPPPIFVLRNPIDIQKMNNDTVYERVNNRVVYLGWYILEKGVYELVDAAEILLNKGVDVKLDFYGTKEIQKLREYVKTKNLHENIKVNGWIEHEEKIKVLHACTMLVLPSHTEGIPNVILEAMATQTPIVSTFVGGLKEGLKDRENALIAEVNNPQDLSDKINEYLKNRVLRDEMAENAYRDVKMKYDVRLLKAKFTRIIDATKV